MNWCYCQLKMLLEARCRQTACIMMQFVKPFIKLPSNRPFFAVVVIGIVLFLQLKGPKSPGVLPILHGACERDGRRSVPLPQVLLPTRYGRQTPRNRDLVRLRLYDTVEWQWVPMHDGT